MIEHDVKNIIAQNLEKEFKATGLSNRKIAESLNVDEKQIRRWRNGESCPSASKLFLICGYLGIDIESMFEN